METVAKTIQSQATAPVNKTCSLKKNVAVTKASCKHGLWLIARVNKSDPYAVEITVYGSFSDCL